MTFNLYFAGSQHSEVEKYIQQRKASRLFTFASSTKKLDKYMEESPRKYEEHEWYVGALFILGEGGELIPVGNE